MSTLFNPDADRNATGGMNPEKDKQQQSGGSTKNDTNLDRKDEDMDDTNETGRSAGKQTVPQA